MIAQQQPILGRKETEMTVRTTVEELLSRLASGNANMVAELFAEEVDFMCAGSEKAPWIRPRRTREDMADFFATMNENFVPEDRSASVEQHSSHTCDGSEAQPTEGAAVSQRQQGLKE